MDSGVRVGGGENWASNVMNLQNVFASLAQTYPSDATSLDTLLLYTVRVHKAAAGLIYRQGLEGKWEVGHSALVLDFDDKQKKAFFDEAKVHAKEAANSRKAQIVHCESVVGSYKFILVPIVKENEAHQVLCLLAESYQKDETVKLLISTQMAVGYYLYGQCCRELEGERWGLQKASSILELVQKSMEAPSYEQAMQTLANEVQSLVGCTYVGVAKIDQDNVELKAISSTANFDIRNNRGVAMKAAMQECVEAKEVIVYPYLGNDPSEDNVEDVLSAHQELLMMTQSSKLASFPLEDPNTGEINGCLIATWSDEAIFEEKGINAIEASRSFVERALTLCEQAEPSMYQKAKKYLSEDLSLTQKRLIFTALALLGVLLVMPFKYKVSADSVLEPVLLRQIEAPFQSTLRQTFVEPGSVVQEGDLLALLEETEIESRLAELIASKDQATKESALALAEKDPSQARISQLEAQKLDAQIAILEDRKDKLEIFAPIGGMVVEGDLKRIEGSPLALGDKLLEIAPLDDMYVEAGVAEDDIKYIQKGQMMELALDAYPGKDWETQVDVVKPRAQIMDGKNVFIVQGKLSGFDQALRPGMKGTAKIGTIYKPLFWILFHKGYDFLRMLIFW